MLAGSLARDPFSCDTNAAQWKLRDGRTLSLREIATETLPPFRTEIAPLLIVIQLEQFQYREAAAIAVVMLLASFAMLFVINAIQAWSRRYS